MKYTKLFIHSPRVLLLGILVFTASFVRCEEDIHSDMKQEESKKKNQDRCYIKKGGVYNTKHMDPNDLYPMWNSYARKECAEMVEEIEQLLKRADHQKYQVLFFELCNQSGCTDFGLEEFDLKEAREKILEYMQDDATVPK